MQPWAHQFYDLYVALSVLAHTTPLLAVVALDKLGQKENAVYLTYCIMPSMAATHAIKQARNQKRVWTGVI
ncbi:hypothetical protein BGZ63DRAFT_381629 [Mariannaea sp. PMI_226]|nr:hypothetical protein BGZ63DRAFT_381629 [Mariannaea sp. PMI_226]